MKGYLKEIFLSIQGEGYFVGTPQIFIRFAKCNLSCKYCDTDFKLSDKFMVKFSKEDLKSYSNPVSSCKVVEIVNNFSQIPSWISFTGGEPLLQADFLKEMLFRFKKGGFDLFLETNGTLVHEFEKVVELIDHVSMDIKLPSHVNSNYLSLHQEFLKLASQKEVEVKIVVSESTSEDELMKAFDIVSSISRDIPLTLQPVSGSDKPTASTLLRFYFLSKDKLNKVKIVPQIHKILGWW
jgi:organic radical activating enzyme